jgi:hypothetical protein
VCVLTYVNFASQSGVVAGGTSQAQVRIIDTTAGGSTIVSDAGGKVTVPAAGGTVWAPVFLRRRLTAVSGTAKSFKVQTQSTTLPANTTQALLTTANFPMQIWAVEV